MTKPAAWFRCYLPPCAGDKRTDDTWQRHWMAKHSGDDHAQMAVPKDGGTDLLPARFVDRGGQGTGRDAFLAERRRMESERDE